MNIKDYLSENVVILDGGMGTLLQKEGLAPGELPERWNISRPDVICNIHRDYFDAGSNVVNTNTFGANSLKFDEEELENIVKAAVENAQRAKIDSKGCQEKWIALDIGPTGRMLAPLGDLDFEEAVAIFAKTVKLGVKYGVDLVFIETMNDSLETKAALLAAKENCDLPVFVSNAYSEDGKLMTGASPLCMIAMLEGMGADAVGINCSYGPKTLAPVIREYIKYASVPVIMKPNAGLPKSVNGKTVFDVLPAEFAADVAGFMKEGVRALGGCCGTTPEYISELAKECRGYTPFPITDKGISVVSSYTKAVTFGKRPVLIGERINPTGKSQFKEALRNGDMEYILKEAISQQEKGVDVLDVNVGLPEIDEVEMLTRSVCEIQGICDLPLQIDTSDISAMESAMRRYNGKPMVNSVSGKKESMDAVFPLVKKYGGLVVALTLDEEGIPLAAKGRESIARKILTEAEKYGIMKKDIIFDPLALTISADSTAGCTTLEAVEKISKDIGAFTSLGVSNVSFGLPRREIINSTFFALALGKGLSCAIMNPYSQDMMKTYHAFCAACGMDDNCEKYIDYAGKLEDERVLVEKKQESSNISGGSSLQNAIIKGLKEMSASITTELVKSKNPLDVIKEEIIPALDTVGVGFENKKVYLPQLLMSAEAAKSAFDVIKTAMGGVKSSDKGTVVIATVKGDIHDIGKNIVKLLLENYGFCTIDMGKDVPPEEILRVVVEKKVTVVGLSALMTTTVPAMEETIKLLREKAPWCKVIVGGAVLNKEYAKMIGADFYAKDAMEGVRFAEEICSSGE
ncbi:MAG: homocysteine methyltransferase [Ruminococcaceae bacterium]|nr:homocysteine methyltransferase [Oscillospiraceae bacterium]